MPDFWPFPFSRGKRHGSGRCSTVGWRLEKQGQKEDRQEHDDARAGEQEKAGAHDAGNGAAGTDGGKGGHGVELQVNHAGGDAARQIENREAQRAHAVFDVVPEDPQRPHIADDVRPSAVQKHAGEEGPVVIGGEAEHFRPCGMSVAGRHDAEQVEDLVERRLRHREFQQEDETVGQNHHARRQGRVVRRDGVTQRQQTSRA